MKRFEIFVYCCLASLVFAAKGLCCQPLETPEFWIGELRNDPRLLARVNYELPPRPAAEDLLAIVQKATGVPLTLAGQPQKGKLYFGSTHALNVPAWKVMEVLALRQIVDGKWEKVGDGYVLHGKQFDFGDPPETDKTRADRKAIAEARFGDDDDDGFFGKLHPLGLDERLRPRFTVIAKKPKLEDVLRRLADATGLTFSLADNLKHHDPNLGEMDLKNVYSYSLMELIATHDLDNGHWEKTETGYRLEGISRTPRPPSRFRWEWAAVGVAVTLIAAGAFVAFRSRAKQARANPPNERG